MSEREYSKQVAEASKDRGDDFGGRSGYRVCIQCGWVHEQGRESAGKLS